MKKRLLTCLTFLTSVIGFSQSQTNPLDEINTIKQAKKFIAKNAASAQLLTVSSDKDTADFTTFLYTKNIGDTFRLKEYDYKVLEKASYPEFRVGYIFLDGSQVKVKTIDSVRTLIISKYKGGTPFSELANAYTMDSAPNGDAGWFKEGIMAKEFEQAVKQHKQNDIFTVDVPDSKWYFVILKTFDDRVSHRMTLLKIKTGI